MTIKYKQNIKLSYLITFLGGLEFALPIMALYYIQELGTVFLITLILAIKTGAIVLLEVPTGIITDRIGRRSTLILARICSLINILLILWGTYLAVFIIAMIFSALTNTLSSGTMTSLIYETIGELEEANIDTPPFKRVSGILHSLWPIGAANASIVGGYIAKFGLRVPIALMLIPLILLLFLVAKLQDPYDESSLHDDKVEGGKLSVWGQTKQAIGIVKENRQVFILVGIGFFSYIGEVSHQLKPLYFDFKDIALTLFGLLYAFTYGLSFIGSLLADPLSEWIGHKRTLIYMSIISQLFVLGSILTTGILSGALLTISSLSWGVTWPIISELMNDELKNEHRTTVLSINNLFKMISLAIFAPFFGYLVDIYSILTLYWIDWVIGFFLIIPFFFLYNKKKDDDGG